MTSCCWRLMFVSIVLAFLSGCSSSVDEEQVDFMLGDMLEPFSPHSLDELDAKTTWIDQPVVDTLDRLRSYQVDQGPMPVSVTEALTIKNDSPENNTKIIGALGRVAPSDGQGVNYDDAVVVHTAGDLKSSNPIMASSVTDFEVGDLISPGLFTFDWEMQPLANAEMVVSWRTSDDRMVDKVVLRNDWTWSDGTPVTAQDVEFSFKVIMSSQVKPPAVRQGTDKIRWVKAYDDRTVVFFHKQALATNVWNVNYPIIPKHIYQETIDRDPSMTRSDEHSRLEDDPITSGPYVLAKRVRNQEIVLRRREGYYMHKGNQVRSKPFFSTVRYKIIPDTNTALLSLKAGETDVQILTAEQWQSQTEGDDFYERNTKITGLEWTSFHFCWNLKTPFFSDIRVRRAMSHVFDYDEMLNKIFYGLYTQGRGTFHPTSWMYPKEAPPAYRQDLDRAETLLEEAGWVDHDGDGLLDKEIDGRSVPFRFTVLTNNTPNGVKVCTLLKECLDKIGIECMVKPTEFTVLTQNMRDHKFQAAMGGWGTGTDPSTSLNIWGTDEGRNYGHYSNPRVDELFEAGVIEFDPSRRAEIYAAIHKILWEDQPYTWLFYRNSFYGFNKRLRGYKFSPRGPFTYGPGFRSLWTPAAQP